TVFFFLFFFFQAEDGIRDFHVTGVQTCALPISLGPLVRDLWTPYAAHALHPRLPRTAKPVHVLGNPQTSACRSEEHTSELQSRENIVCRLLLEKKKRHLSQHLRPYPYVRPDASA